MASWMVFGHADAAGSARSRASSIVRRRSSRDGAAPACSRAEWRARSIRAGRRASSWDGPARRGRARPARPSSRARSFLRPPRAWRGTGARAGSLPRRASATPRGAARRAPGAERSPRAASTRPRSSGPADPSRGVLPGHGRAQAAAVEADGQRVAARDRGVSRQEPAVRVAHERVAAREHRQRREALELGRAPPEGGPARGQLRSREGAQALLAGGQPVAPGGELAVPAEGLGPLTSPAETVARALDLAAPPRLRAAGPGRPAAG